VFFLGEQACKNTAAIEIRPGPTKPATGVIPIKGHSTIEKQEEGYIFILAIYNSETFFLICYIYFLVLAQQEEDTIVIRKNQEQQLNGGENTVLVHRFRRVYLAAIQYL